MSRLPVIVGLSAIVFVSQTALAASQAPDSTTSTVDQPDTNPSQWFRAERSSNLAATVAFTVLVIALVYRGKRGKIFFIREIAGLSAVEDAVGRAAEMGRPVSFVPGLGAVSDPATVASMSFLSNVAHRCARLRARVYVPNYSALTFPVARTVVKDAFVRAGREAAYNPDDVAYFTSRQMTYTMAVIGLLTRQRPAASFLVGHFYSESLILAETGASIGAIQIGACDAVSQLPFFITTCDHTLIGEELFAAGALLSEDPLARSTIATHDWFKAAAVVLILAAFVLWGLDAAGISGAGEWARGLSSLLKEGR